LHYVHLEELDGSTVLQLDGMLLVEAV